MKIIGYTVGTTLPKSNLAQTDPKKGDYVKNKEALDDRYYTEPEIDEKMTVVNDAISEAITEAQEHADSGDTTTLQNANTYTDNAVAQKAQVTMKTWTATAIGGV